jgi:DegV family protein with EDD domain
LSKIAFVTDSTAYIPAELTKELNISVVPQVLIWGDKTFEDGVDIQPDEFYAKLKTATVMPSTSQASIVNMEKAFRGLVEQDYEVVGIFLSAKLSGTMQSAIQGREALGSAAEKVTLVDSNSTAMAMGFHVLSAARAAKDGANLRDCVSVAEKARDHTGIFFAVETLEFLHRGGRIGGAQRFIGTALNMKPVLALKDGKVEAVERIRTKGKALERVLDLVVENTRGKSPIRLATLHANAEEEARGILNRAIELLNPTESILTAMSPVVGTHTGPGTIGLAYMAGM